MPSKGEAISMPATGTGDSAHVDPPTSDRRGARTDAQAWLRRHRSAGDPALSRSAQGFLLSPLREQRGVRRYGNRALCHAPGRTLRREVLGDTQRAPLERLRRYFEDLTRMAGQSAAIQGCLIGSLSLEVATTSALLQGHLSSSFTLWQAAVAMVLQEAVEKGDLPKSIGHEALAGFVLNSWEGALLRSQADKSDAPLERFSALHV